MALATFSTNAASSRNVPFSIPEAISYPQCRIRIHSSFSPSPRVQEEDDQRREEGPKSVLLFSGLAQLVLGISVLLTLRMQLESILPTAVAACAWLTFTGVAGLCASCYVSSAVNRSAEYVRNNQEPRNSFIICFRVYIGLLVIGVGLTFATALHGLHKEISDPHGGKSDSWEPGMSCIAFGLLLCCVNGFIIGSVKKALREYSVKRESGPVPHEFTGRTTVIRPPARSSCGSLPPPYTEHRGAALLRTRPGRPEAVAEAEAPLLGSRGGESAQVPPAYSNLVGPHLSSRNRLSALVTANGPQTAPLGRSANLRANPPPPTYSCLSVPQMPPSYSEATGFEGTPGRPRGVREAHNGESTLVPHSSHAPL